jgi:hypothetical protein
MTCYFIYILTILQFSIKLIQYFKKRNIFWGLGIGDWGLGIGDWAQSPIPNPQSPIPNPQA